MRAKVFPMQISQQIPVGRVNTPRLPTETCIGPFLLVKIGKNLVNVTSCLVSIEV